MPSEFLNSRAMLTPGAAGATTMILTGSLTMAFQLPGAWTALIISSVFGLLVAASDHSLPLVQRAIFYVLNSLTIFSVAYGLNSVGFEAQMHTRSVDPAFSESFFHPWTIR
jgi:hypothetical protein